MRIIIAHKSSIILGALLCLCGQMTLAANTIPRFTVGSMNYTLTTPGIQIPGGPRTGPNHYKTYPVAYGIGATMTGNRFYVDLYSQFTSDADDTVSVQNPVSFSEVFSGKRNDYAVSVGYAVNDNTSLYFGYKLGTTNASGEGGSDSSFKTKGSFVGGSLAWLVSRSNALSLNIAVADLQGEIDYTIVLPTPVPARLDAVTKSVGVTVGLGWRARLSRLVSFALTVDSYKYTFDDIIDRRTGTFTGEVVEEMLTAKLAVSYRFAK